MSLLFNMLTSLVTFLSRSRRLLIDGASHHLQCFWSPPKWSLSLFPLFSHLFAMKWWDYDKAFYCVDNNKLWKILKEIGIPDHLTCLLRNLYSGQEATLRPGHGTTDWFQIGKGVRQGCIFHPAYLTYIHSTSWETLGWRKHKLESRLPGEISITLDTQMTSPFGRKQRRTEEPLKESERGEWKSWLKAQHPENWDHGIWSHTSWEIDEETVEPVADFIFLGSKITTDGDCRHEIKRCLLLGRKVWPT